MKLREWITKAVEEREGQAASVVIDVCRFKLGMTYDRVLARVREQYPDLAASDWDELCALADEAPGLAVEKEIDLLRAHACPGCGQDLAHEGPCEVCSRRAPLEQENAWAIKLGLGSGNRPAVQIYTEGRQRSVVTLACHEALLAGLRAGLRVRGADRPPWGLSLVGGGVQKEDWPEGPLWVAHGELEVMFGNGMPEVVEAAVRGVLEPWGKDHSVEVFGG